MNTLRNALLALGLAALAGCQVPGGAMPTETLLVQGALTYRERIALPPDSVATVELRRFDASGERVAAVLEIALQGRQVPIPFLVEAAVAPDAAAVYELRGSVTLGGSVFRITRPLLLDPAAGTLDLGMLRLLPAEEVAFGTHYLCGPVDLLFGAEGESARMVVNGQVFDMVHAPAASGVLYRALGQETTFFHGKGKEALVEIEGRRLPACHQSEPPTPPFRARGQEPGWNVTLADGRAELVLDYGQQRVSLPLFATSSEGRVTRFRAADGTHRMAMDVARRQCNDSMSGMPYPYVVALEFDDRVLSGCGGEAIDLLAGREWVVEDLDGGGIIDRSRVTLEFDAESGRVHGRGSCNRYNAGFSLTGEGISFSGAAATMMACPEALMNQEQKFFRILEGVNRFDIDATGALVLSGTAGTMKAYADTRPSE
jgi:heat shock protein HslJ/uncharacterized lipoprotein YbaY